MASTGADGDLYTVHAMESGGGLVVHARVPAARLAAATGRSLDAANTKQLSAYMESLAERVGPDPGGARWKAEVLAAIKEDWVGQGVLMSIDDPTYDELLADDGYAFARSFEEWCGEGSPYKAAIDTKLKTGNGTLSLEDAQLFQVCDSFAGVLAAATREARTSYAGLVHGYYNLVARLADGAAPAPDCYIHLQDTTSASRSTGLQDEEPGWGALVQRAITASSEVGGGGRPRGLHCLTAAGATIVSAVQPRMLAPGGFRQYNFQNGQFEVQDSAVVKFVSTGRDAAGLHTAVSTDPVNCTFPPMTLFTAIDVRLGSFKFDGTEGLLRQCKVKYGGRAPAPTPDASGRLHIGRAQLIEWLNGLNLPTEEVVGLSLHTLLASDDPEERQRGFDWLHTYMLPEGVESTIYTVKQTLVTVQATYLLPAAAAAVASGDGSDGNIGLSLHSPRHGGPDKADAVHAKLMADSTKLG
jgi:hypothetical protein